MVMAGRVLSLGRRDDGDVLKEPEDEECCDDWCGDGCEVPVDRLPTDPHPLPDADVMLDGRWRWSVPQETLPGEVDCTRSDPVVAGANALLPAREGAEPTPGKRA
mmetsp:Transcript_11024/g.34993  ORF Transcript_11024/g.34993 Transcript_11024/m.34993 type:complete len:105 (+) Transcript_11024:1252-1566(+)